MEKYQPNDKRNKNNKVHSAVSQTPPHKETLSSRKFSLSGKIPNGQHNS